MEALMETGSHHAEAAASFQCPEQDQEIKQRDKTPGAVSKSCSESGRSLQRGITAGDKGSGGSLSKKWAHPGFFSQIMILTNTCKRHHCQTISLHNKKGSEKETSTVKSQGGRCRFSDSFTEVKGKFLREEPTHQPCSPPSHEPGPSPIEMWKQPEGLRLIQAGAKWK